MPAPTIPTVIQQMKGYVTKQIGSDIFEEGFYDHIIRNNLEYDVITDYIQDNHWKWTEDRFYKK